MDLEKIRRTLEARLQELMSEAKEIDSELREKLDPDVEERAVELEDDEVLEGLGNAAVTEIGHIRQALRRIDDGSYGECASCGDKINEARLEALPHAMLCMKCAQ
jgi:RNA polymerase-binding protein DksA